MKNKICREAIERFGVNTQMVKAIEELSELQKALAKFINRQYVEKTDKELIDDIIDEIADCSIMLRQMTLIFADDLEDDVFNLYTVLQSNKNELIKQIELMPMSESLLKFWKENTEIDLVKKAVRFLMISNFCVNGCSSTLRFGQNSGNEKGSILKSIEDTFIRLRNVKFMCCDFRKVLPKIQFRDKEQDAFIYADPPYLDTSNNYHQEFKEQDTIDLFEVLVNSKIRFALSEFDNPIVLDLAKQHNLEVITIGERQNMKNRRTEILVVNYESPALYSLFRNQDLSLSVH